MNKNPFPFAHTTDLICLSHLRWNFVFQRPQHLMVRFARQRRVFFFEEPIFTGSWPHLHLETCPQTGVEIATPFLREGTSSVDAAQAQRDMLADLIADQDVSPRPLLWYYTPMALAFSRQLKPSLVVYDCMDELSAFQGAPTELRSREAELFNLADLVFTGGQGLYEAKQKQHPNVHAFPSSVDVEHFRRGRTALEEPADQSPIPHPRLGYVGVIDERMDWELLSESARLRPSWHFIMIGPLVKVHSDNLPQANNIHYLGSKSYGELPAYLASWDIALLPFARNESTRFISPTKTPEYLAAGRQTISTSIRDVVHPYGDLGLVKIADSAPDLVAAAEQLIVEDHTRAAWLEQVDKFLANISWDRTWSAMNELIQQPRRNQTLKEGSLTI